MGIINVNLADVDLRDLMPQMSVFFHGAGTDSNIVFFAKFIGLDIVVCWDVLIKGMDAVTMEIVVSVHVTNTLVATIDAVNVHRRYWVWSPRLWTS
jgi:hypothetical protein